MKCKAKLFFCSFLMLGMLTFSFTGVYAASILIATDSPYLGYGYGNNNWTNMTNALNTASGGAIATTSFFDNLPQMLSFNAIMLDARQPGGTLSGTEIANISAFIATGRRALLIGENNSWASWDSQILGIAGGTYSGTEYTGTSTPVLAHPLTLGVGSVYFSGDGLASGGTSLFTQNVATLWGPGANVLTVLSVNAFDDSYWTNADNSVFGTNVAEWLAATPVPLPPGLLLLGSGLLGLAGWRRFRKS
jgi:hypothetical protein